ncbi:Chloroplastic group IIA intron splicing facilitator CRS1 [Morus notabilis]|uniref:Chloroplastic group IIA intron splicing facilitator CRS1 n=1 Tax=Morus notabilis TaxID=981085 RepID=W9QX15_9ROSA|nr:CRM-domain containing factor CFM3, chloroplastic/mitochondrial [Morus notabilis]EXB56911.1 Chloroplastic group IIA intron splicing facilitator CRS1 [Morus notabilis]
MAAFTVTKFSELPLRNSLPLTSHSHSLNLLISSSSPNPSFHILKTFCSVKTTERSSYPWKDQNPKPSSSSSSSSHRHKPPSAPWLNKWPPVESSDRKVAESTDRDRTDRPDTVGYVDRDRGRNAIERIVLRLRNLGLGSDDEDEDDKEGDIGLDGQDAMPVTGEEKLGDLLRREWIRPDFVLEEEESKDDLTLPWEREEEEKGVDEGTRELRKRRVNAPTLAELTIEDEELRRLRRMGMFLRDRISVPKAGLTQAVLEKIHDKWRKEELVRLKFHEVLAHDMKTAHEIVERRTGGLVTWRSGSVMVVYRGSNYEGPPKTQPVNKERDALFIPDVSSAENFLTRSGDSLTSNAEKSETPVRNPVSVQNMTEEEAEFNSLLDDLGPRFDEWWGTGVIPVDADLLPPKIPGYKTPFRLLPTGMRSRLTNGEMTNLRKVAKSLPSHFALGRNRNHQGLAAAIIKLWEKSLVAKIAVKRGIQNTNNKLMAEELKNLTGGVLLLRNKYYIVIYRGKDFLPTTVAATLAERQKLAKQVQDLEEQVRVQDIEQKMQKKAVDSVPSGEEEGQALAGTLAEFYEAQARWGREITSEEREKMIEEAAVAKHARLVKRIEHKAAVAQAKKLRAEKLLAKIEASMVPAGPDYDQETITEEERVMFRRVGLRMKAYLPLGIRGVFDGVIENMHLHWKHRELVKLITKQKTLAFVEDTARLLEYESGGILVAIERVPKGFALIYYRGKNYRRPISLRPRNLLTKAKALKRSVAMQRHEALSQHISELETTIEQMQDKIVASKSGQDEGSWSTDENLNDNVSEFIQSENDDAFEDSDYNDSDEEINWEDEEDEE